MSENHVKIIRVSHLPYPEGPAVAAVTMTYGAVVIRALLMKGQAGLFLSLPARRTQNGKWLELTFFRDPTLHKEAERLALRAYRELPPISESKARRNLPG